MTTPPLTPPSTAQPSSVSSSRPAAAADAARLQLTQYVDFARLGRMQRDFAAMTGLNVSLRDADDQTLDFSGPQPQRAERHAVRTLPAKPEPDHPGRYVSPILVEGDRIGSVVIEPAQRAVRVSRATIRRVSEQLGLPADQVQKVVKALRTRGEAELQTAAHLICLWATGMTRSCHQEHQLQQRIDELSALYRMSTVLSAQRSLQVVLDTACREVTQVMKVKAASIRLLDSTGKELIPKAVCNLSQAYIDKGPVLVQQSDIYQRAIRGEVVYVEDMATDPRVLFPDVARAEGLVSILATGMMYRGQPIGVIRLYTGEYRRFSHYEISLLRAVAQLTATAIENSRLFSEHEESQRVQRQLRLAADVQRRMLPSAMPFLPPFDISARYVPSTELSGDFYDFINLDGHLGIAVADVVGKGVPASLLMAAVRASLRAYAQDVYDIDEIVARVNVALSRDTLDNEFATLFYGVLDPATRRLTYCNAGHEPPLLLRQGKLSSLTAGGMIVGVDEKQEYDKGLVDLLPGDLLLIYTDGLSEAFNFAGQKFGRQRIIEAMLQTEGHSAQQALNHVLWQMRRFVGLNRSPDDLTLVCIRVTHQQPLPAATLHVPPTRTPR